VNKNGLVKKIVLNILEFGIYFLLDLCVLYMSLSKYSNKKCGESDQALYSSYLKFLIEKLVVYNDLDSNKSTIRKDLFEFFQIEIEQIKFVLILKKEKFFFLFFSIFRNSNHFSVIENFLCSLNNWSLKYLFDMPDEVFHLGNQLLPSLIDIWRRKCSDKPKVRFKKQKYLIHFKFNFRQKLLNFVDYK
jgi:ribosomal protein L23